MESSGESWAWIASMFEFIGVRLDVLTMASLQLLKAESVGFSGTPKTKVRFFNQTPACGMSGLQLGANCQGPIACRIDSHASQSGWPGPYPWSLRVAGRGAFLARATEVHHHEQPTPVLRPVRAFVTVDLGPSVRETALELAQCTASLRVLNRSQIGFLNSFRQTLGWPIPLKVFYRYHTV